MNDLEDVPKDIKDVENFPDKNVWHKAVKDELKSLLCFFEMILRK